MGGKSLARHFFSQTFVTKVGNISMDSVGERIPITNINQLEWNSTNIRVRILPCPAGGRFRKARAPPVFETLVRHWPCLHRNKLIRMYSTDGDDAGPRKFEADTDTSSTVAW